MNDRRRPGAASSPLCLAPVLRGVLIALAVLFPIAGIRAAKTGAQSAPTAQGADLRKPVTGDLLPGDPAPEFRVRKWLQKGSFDAVRLASNDGRCITVVEFWTDGYPASRTVLSAHDRMQISLKENGIRFLAVAEGRLDDTKAALKQFGLTHIAVAYDDGQQILRALKGPGRRVPLPFAVVIEQSGDAGAGTVLWKGQMIEDTPSIFSKYCRASGLDGVITRIASGEYDVNRERAMQRDRQDVQWLSDELERACRSGSIRRVCMLGEHAVSRSWSDESRPMLFQPLLNAASKVLEAGDATKEQRSDALEMARTAIGMGSGEYAIALHVCALALFRNGDVKGAVSTERRAQRLPMEYVTKEECADALAKYEAALRGGGADTTKTAGTEPARRNPGRSGTGAAIESVTAGQAVSDLMALYESMRMNYSGYDDMSRYLKSQGSSWRKRNAEYARRINARNQWAVCDFMDLLSEYVGVVPDNHYLLHGRFTRKGVCQEWWSDGTNNVIPYFADIRVRETGGRMIVVDAPGGLQARTGDIVTGVPIVGDPYTAQTGATYLFPTLPRRSASDKEYLLGVLWRLPSYPECVKVSVTPSSSDGRAEARGLSLPVHRGRGLHGRNDNDPPSWSLQLGPIPVLAIKHFSDEGIEDMPRSAVTLRDLPVILVDLRGNPGGDAAFASRWFETLSNHAYRLPGRQGLRAGETDPLRRWEFALFTSFTGDGTVVDAADRPYSGRLFVITDNASASASEVFADLAAQLPGTVLIGENTSGGTTYASDMHVCDMPNSGLHAEFGTAKFTGLVRPDREGTGMFPDYWLDEPDAIAAVQAYCAL